MRCQCKGRTLIPFIFFVLSRFIQLPLINLGQTPLLGCSIYTLSYHIAIVRGPRDNDQGSSYLSLSSKAKRSFGAQRLLPTVGSCDASASPNASAVRLSPSISFSVAEPKNTRVQIVFTYLRTHTANTIWANRYFVTSSQERGDLSICFL